MWRQGKLERGRLAWTRGTPAYFGSSKVILEDEEGLGSSFPPAEGNPQSILTFQYGAYNGWVKCLSIVILSRETRNEC